MAPSIRVLLLSTALLPALLAQKANEDYSTPEKRAAQAVSLSDPDRPERLVVMLGSHEVVAQIGVTLGREDERRCHLVAPTGSR